MWGKGDYKKCWPRRPAEKIELSCEGGSAGGFKGGMPSRPSVAPRPARLEQSQAKYSFSYLKKIFGGARKTKNVKSILLGGERQRAAARESRQAQRGEWPGQKPFGYIYDHRLRNIVLEPKEAKIVKRIYEEFATGRHTLKSISARLAELGGKEKSNYAIEYLLTDDLYIGIMRWKGEVYEGKYQPLISKQLFAKVQNVLADRRKPRKSKKRHDFPFVGLFHCSCGSMFTAQFAKGNGGLYRYYRCTRKHGACAEKYIQESELQKQVIEKSQTIALPADWAKEMLEKLEREEKSQAQSADAFAEATRKKIFALQEKLDKLLEGYLDNLIDEDTYKRKKESLVQQKIALKGERDTLLRKRMSGWIEPMRNYINTLIYAGKIASEQSPVEIAHFAQKIGTNRLISEKIASWDFVPPYDFAAQFLASRAFWRGEQTIALASKKSGSPVWCACQDSNLEPLGPKPSALSIELQARIRTDKLRQTLYPLPAP